MKIFSFCFYRNHLPPSHTHNAMFRYDFDKRTKPGSLEFKQPCNALSIQLWPDFVLPASKAAHFRLMKSVTALSIISLQILKGTLIVKNLSENLLVVPYLASSFSLQILGISLCLWIYMKYTLYLPSTLFRWFKQP